VTALQDALLTSPCKGEVGRPAAGWGSRTRAADGWGASMTRFDRTRTKTTRARRLRREMTDAEKKLWWRLRNDQLGVSFRRQHPVGPFVVDFIAPAHGLVIELDGGQHGTDAGLVSDARRTAFLAGRGLRVMRFWNSEINSNLEGVLETIWNALQSREAGAATPTPSLPLAGGGSSLAWRRRAKEH
jgi:very-short-patch-repair endonuclease